MTPSVVLPLLFDLEQTLDCGQAFRWKRTEKTNTVSVWEGIAQGRHLRIRQDTHGLTFFCEQDEFNQIWSQYFDLSADYNAIQKQLASLHPVLEEAISYAPGIRILRQDPWETVCSFIISQNNNIPRIKGIVERFSILFGEEIPFGFAFPAAERAALLTLDDLAPLCAGYRAKYILASAKAVTEGVIDCNEIARRPIEYGRSELQKIPGIGPKVAECILLYGFHKMEAFPMDVWMKRAMETLLPGHSPEELGEYAGLAQQYLFHYSRMHPELFTRRLRGQQPTALPF